MTEVTNRNGGATRFRLRFPETDPESLIGYQALVGFMFEATRPAEYANVPFRAYVESCVFDGIVASRAEASALHLIRTPAQIARAASDDIAVVVYTDGGCDVTINDLTRRINPGEILILDLARPAEILTPDMTNYALLISRQRLQAWSDVLMDVHGMIVPHGSIQRILSQFVQALLAEAGTMHESEAAQIGELTLQFVGACLQLLRPRQVEGGSSTVPLSRMRAFIERELANPELGPQTLMQEFGLSRPTLYRQFEPLGGVIRYITERRLQRAFRIVTDPARPPPRISQLAYDFGFSSVSVFGRAFRDTFGLTPSEARKLAWRKVPDDKSPPVIATDINRFIVLD